MVEKRGRLGRKNGKGFYDYPEGGTEAAVAGARRSAAAQARSRRDRRRRDLKHRLLGIQALETARCFEEGVLTDVREADVGSILGFGFAPFSGGTLSYIDMMGTQALRRTVRGAGDEVRAALCAAAAADRHGRQGRHLLRPFRPDRPRGVASRANAARFGTDRAASEPSPRRSGGEGRRSERSERAGVGGSLSTEKSAPTPDPSPPLAALAGEGSRDRRKAKRAPATPPSPGLRPATHPARADARRRVP